MNLIKIGHIIAIASVPIMGVIAAPLSIGLAEPPRFPNKEIRIAYFSHDLPALDLFKSFDPDTFAVVAQIFDPLIYPDLDGNLKPGLALSWKRMSDKRWVFELRQGVRFHNGEGFDANAVKFTFDYLIQPQNKAAVGFLYSNIESVTVLGPYEVAFDLKVPDSMFLNSLFTAVICPPNYIQEKGMDHFHEHPMGTGPFQLEKWERGRRISLSANPSYWRSGLPHLHKVHFLILPENQWAAALQKGQVDFVPNLAGTLTRQAVSIPGVKIIKRLGLYSYKGLLNPRGPLADVRVRQALNYALDKEAMVKFADFGNAHPLASLGEEGEFGANPRLRPYEFNPTKAKALLAQAGYPSGFSLKILAADLSAPIAKIIKANFAVIGVRAKLEIVPRIEVFAKTGGYKVVHHQIPDYDLVLYLIDNPIYHFGFFAKLSLESHSIFSLSNSPQYDRRLADALQVVDEELARKKLEELDRYIHDEALMIFTTQRIITAAIKKRFNINKFSINGHLDYEILSNADEGQD